MPQREVDMNSADYWIEKLSLQAHPEGGYFRETYCSNDIIRMDHLPKRYEGDRPFSTAIYYLLKGDQFSAFHWLKSDEIWHFHTGSSMTIYSIDAAGELASFGLGPDLDSGGNFQVAIPAGRWFGAQCDDRDGFTLVGNTVAPGFGFADFEIGKREVLLKKYPEHRDIIERLTNQ